MSPDVSVGGRIDGERSQGTGASKVISEAVALNVMFKFVPVLLRALGCLKNLARTSKIRLKAQE